MKNLICSLFLIISVSLMVQVQNTNCSGFEQDDIDWNNFSPIVDLPDIDEHDDSEQRSRNVETLSSSPQKSQPNSQNTETLSSSPQRSQPNSQNTETLSSSSHHSQVSPVYSFNGDEDWYQEYMEKKFLEEVKCWGDIRAQIKNITRLTQICAKFSWEHRESSSPTFCSRKYCYVMNFRGCRRKYPILADSGKVFIDMENVMLYCHCYNLNRIRGDLINENYFAVAKHSDNSYFLFKHATLKNCFSLHGFVTNFTY